jgi:hypothetical protein
MATLNNLSITSISQMSFDKLCQFIEDVRYRRSLVKKKSYKRKSPEKSVIDQLSPEQAEQLLERMRELGKI